MLLEQLRDSIDSLDFELGVDPYSSEAEIMALEKLLMLNDYDLPKYGPDADYGGETITAVENYQKDNGLDVTGIADPATLQYMKQALDGLNIDLPAIETHFRDQILSAAESYVGTMEENGDNNSSLIAEFLRSDEYSRNQSGSPSAPLGSAWCAGFASHVLEGISPHIANYDVLAKGIMRQFDDQGAFYDMDSGYTPQPGDMIFFDRGADGDWRGHVGFVKEVLDDGSLITIEGNKHHPDFADEDSYGYDPDRPDGVRIVEYSPEEFAGERMLGFGNSMEMYALNVGLDNVASITTPQTIPSMAPEISQVSSPRMDF